MKNKLRYRQIHLDFHTCEHLPTIGKDFNGEVFAKTLSEAGVDSITCFSRGHHGWIYYDSEKFAHLKHPNLSNYNLLKEQIEACHRYDIKVPIYTTIQWDSKVAREHREWLVMDVHGGPFKQTAFKPGFYQNICLNTDYVGYLKELIRDLFENLGELDGLFLDILNLQPCCCPNCVKEMQEKNLDPTDVDVRNTFAQYVFDRFKTDMTNFIRDIQPGCPIFYNAGFIGTRHRALIDTFTHLEIESLPGSGQWGYDHFPVTARYARTLGLEFMGMTGKFHTDWGDFSSFKNQEALEYECFKSIAYCGKSSIGDQLHPLGAISKPVYDLIGSVYNSIKEKEPFLRRAKPLTEAAIMIPEEFMPIGTVLVTEDLVGATKLLTEIDIQFNIIDSVEDFTQYKLIVLPDNIPFNSKLQNKIESYIRSGGKVLLSYKSGIINETKDFANVFGIKLIGEAEYSPDYIVADGLLGTGLHTATEYVMYEKGMQIELVSGREELKVNEPYFNREWNHFTSHNHTPSSMKYCYPAAVSTNDTLYFSHPIFMSYQSTSSRWIKTMVKNAINKLIGKQLITHNGPSTLELTVNEQREESRLIVHALHYIPVRKCKKLDIVEDKIELYDIEINLNVENRDITSIYVTSNQKEILFRKEGDRVIFTVEKIHGHQMIALDYLSGIGQ